MSVEEWFDHIIEEVRVKSGYPYPEGYVAPDNNRAFTYGLAVGTLLKAKDDWVKRMQA